MLYPCKIEYLGAVQFCKRSASEAQSSVSCEIQGNISKIQPKLVSGGKIYNLKLVLNITILESHLNSKLSKKVSHVLKSLTYTILH